MWQRFDRPGTFVRYDHAQASLRCEPHDGTARVRHCPLLASAPSTPLFVPVSDHGRDIRIAIAPPPNLLVDSVMPHDLSGQIGIRSPTRQKRQKPSEDTWDA